MRVYIDPCRIIHLAHETSVSVSVCLSVSLSLCSLRGFLSVRAARQQNSDTNSFPVICLKKTKQRSTGTIVP